MCLSQWTLEMHADVSKWPFQRLVTLDILNVKCSGCVTVEISNVYSCVMLDISKS